MFQTEKSIKIKIEVDTCPPLNFKTEQKLLLQPHSFMTRCFTLPDLFAGKMHALVSESSLANVPLMFYSPFTLIRS